MSYMSARLANMAENLAGDMGPSEDDRTILRYAAHLLDTANMSEVSKIILTDKDALRAGLEQLTPKQVGVVLALVLARVNELGDTPLPYLLRVLTSQVDDLVEALGER